MDEEVVVGGVGVLVSLGIAIVGWAKANTANRTAKKATDAADRSAVAAEQSADEARRANAIAEQANERAQRAEVRATTRSDVRWDSRIKDDNWVVFNKGADDARDVIVILRAGDSDQYQRMELGDIASMSGQVVMSLADLREAKRTSNRAVRDSFSGSGIEYFPSGRIPLVQRILWTDAAGGSHTSDEDEHNVG